MSFTTLPSGRLIGDEQLTPWHDNTKAPGHRGVYQTHSERYGTWFQYWNGLHWGYQANTVRQAFKDGLHGRSISQYHDWRGLKTKDGL